MVRAAAAVKGRSNERGETWSNWRCRWCILGKGISFASFPPWQDLYIPYGFSVYTNKLSTRWEAAHVCCKHSGQDSNQFESCNTRIQDNYQPIV